MSNFGQFGWSNKINIVTQSETRNISENKNIKNFEAYEFKEFGVLPFILQDCTHTCNAVHTLTGFADWLRA